MKNYKASLWDCLIPLLPRLDALLRGGADDPVIDTVSSLVSGVNADLRWEIGPDPESDGRLNMFSFSVNGKEALLSLTNALIMSAPSAPGWAFYGSKPPKPFSGTIDVVYRNQAHVVDVAPWSYVLLRHNQGKPYDVLLFPKGEKPDSPHVKIAAILLVESALGEREYLKNIGDIVVVGPTDVDANKEKGATPVKYLREQIATLVGEQNRL